MTNVKAPAPGPAITPTTHRPDGAVVLAAVDDSVAAVSVARAAGEAALTRGGEAVAFTAIAFRPQNRSLAELGWITEPGSVALDAEATLGRARPMLDRLGVNYRTRVGTYVARGGRWGRASQIARAIQRAADGEAATLVVIGHTPGRRPARRSVAGCILRRTTCDVLVVPVIEGLPPATEMATAGSGRHKAWSAS